MALVVGTSRGWLDVHGYLSEVPERWPIFIAAAAGYLDLPEAEVREKLGAGAALADLASARRKSIDGLKSRVTAALQRTEAALACVFLSQVVEQLVDLPLAEQAQDLAG